ncbi:MAG TPA: Spy/CpxP family protein refolding chaperone [Acidobacteriota bacterium]|nr:Spy/CpxP family protein refolding chaperone [Acidobacteriota bacterium]
MKRMLVIVLALAVPALALAQPGGTTPEAAGRGHGPMHCLQKAGPGARSMGAGIGHLLALGDEIGITDEQRAGLKELQTRFQLERIDKKALVEKAQVGLHALMRESDAAESQVMRAIDELARLRADMQKMRYTHRKQVESTLTAEQVAKLKELRQKRHMEGREKMRKKTDQERRMPHGGR